MTIAEAKEKEKTAAKETHIATAKETDRPDTTEAKETDQTDETGNDVEGNKAQPHWRGLTHCTDSSRQQES